MQSLLIFDFFIGYLRYYYDLIGSYTSLLTKITIWAVRLTIQVVAKSDFTIQVAKSIFFLASPSIYSFDF